MLIRELSNNHSQPDIKYDNSISASELTARNTFIWDVKTGRNHLRFVHKGVAGGAARASRVLWLATEMGCSGMRRPRTRGAA